MKWKTKEGVEIEINDLTNSHLTNIIEFLRGNCERYRMRVEFNMASGFPTFQGEMAQHQSEQEFFSSMEFIRSSSDESFLSEYILQYDSLIEEAEKRKLDVVL